MEDVYKKLKKNLNWRERIVLKLFKKTCIMFYRKGMSDCFNFYNKIWYVFSTLIMIQIEWKHIIEEKASQCLTIQMEHYE